MVSLELNCELASVDKLRVDYRESTHDLVISVRSGDPENDSVVLGREGVTKLREFLDKTFPPPVPILTARQLARQVQGGLDVLASNRDLSSETLYHVKRLRDKLRTEIESGSFDPVSYGFDVSDGRVCITHCTRDDKGRLRLRQQFFLPLEVVKAIATAGDGAMGGVPCPSND